MTATASPLKAVQFLQRWPTPFPHLVAVHIDPDTHERGLVEGKAFPTPVNWSDVASWVSTREGKANLYFTVNECAPVDKKALKTDMRTMVALHVDIDVPNGEEQETGAAKLLAAIQTYAPEPSIIVKSGGGVQAFWILQPGDYLTLDGDPIKIEAAERYTRGLEKDVAAALGVKVDNCFNADRIMRLPWTTNIPDVKKLAKGRVPMVAEQVGDPSGLRWPLGTFQPTSSHDLVPTGTPGTPSTTTVKIDWESARDLYRTISVEDLRARKVEEHAILSLQHGDNLDRLAEAHARIGHRVAEGAYSSFSQVTLAIATAMLKAHFEPEECAAVMSDPAHPGNKHVTRQKTEKEKHRAVERAVQRAVRDLAKRRLRESATEAGVPEWRGGTFDDAGLYPRPNILNAVIGIEALGISFSMDVFHEQVLAHKNEQTRVVEQFATDTLSDPVERIIRLALAEQWLMDAGNALVHDACVTIAEKSRFNPVVEYLDGLTWDGTPRLDRAAVDYFSVEDSELNCAVVRKALVASVRRARHPGCKFDNIPVLESPEGWNKSSGIRLLYGDDNFRDHSILNRDDRSVFETLQGVWGLEIPDLSGMSRAEVEHTKALASRQEDTARAAYARNISTRPRQCVVWGTTNDNRYLQSQTGNRRFWPLPMTKSIDLGKLAHDRDQLWAEAAHYEAAGESLFLEERLWPAAGAAQEKRRVLDPWEDTLQSMPYSVKRNDGIGTQDIRVVWEEHQEVVDGDPETVGAVECVATATVLEHVLRVPPAQMSSAQGRRLALTMERLGWRRRSSGHVRTGKTTVRGYWRHKVKVEVEKAAPEPEIPF